MGKDRGISRRKLLVAGGATASGVIGIGLWTNRDTSERNLQEEIEYMNGPNNGMKDMVSVRLEPEDEGPYRAVGVIDPEDDIEKLHLPDYVDSKVGKNEIADRLLGDFWREEVDGMLEFLYEDHLGRFNTVYETGTEEQIEEYGLEFHGDHGYVSWRVDAERINSWEKEPNDTETYKLTPQAEDVHFRTNMEIMPYNR